MSVFTSLTTLRNHLQAFDFDAIEVDYVQVLLQGTNEAQLPHNGLVDGSVRVFTLHANEPAGPVSFALNGESWVGTGYQAALPASTLVAADDLPEERYIEGVDYAVNDDAAEIKRLPGSNIPDGGTVYVWLMALTQAIEDVDYEVYLDRGTLARIVTGSLPDPARVYVSYETSPARASDALLNQAIADAEGKIIDRLKDGYDETSEDFGLQVGATELALAYVCDDLAGGVLARNGDSTSDKRGQRFMDLARRYEERAFNSLTPFLRIPIPSASKRQTNSPVTPW